MSRSDLDLRFTQLVYHVLAHAPLRGPGNVYDRRYVAWAAERFDPADQQLLVHDAALLARSWNGDARYDALHRFCELHAGLAEFRACSARSLSELHASEVADPELLEVLRELPGAELLHATLALLAPGFTRVLTQLEPTLEQASVSVRAWIDRLDECCLGLAGARVELVWALGVHGRALADRILVGAPADWNGSAPARQAVLAAHEFTVARVSTNDYVADEWAALTELAYQLREADPQLRDAHRAWLASLNLSPLLTAALARGYLTASDADALEHDAASRADRLSAARASA
jgi:hypothetical protein